MEEALLDVLVDPINQTGLRLEIEKKTPEGKILSGSLQNSDGETYPILNGIPRFVDTSDSEQEQTQRSFGYKWKQIESFDSPAGLERYRDWFVEKYGFESAEEMQSFFADKNRILEAGCGGGFSASTWIDKKWEQDSKANFYGIDISDAVDVAQKKLGNNSSLHFIQADLMHLPFAENSFDVIFSEGVLHHTPSTQDALKAVVKKLSSGGEILFYIYRKKGAIREFTDDHIRDLISDLPPEEAWEMLRPLTKLGRALAELNTEVEVPEDIPFLGIKAGKQDVQRLLYWNFAKMYWNDKLSFEENHHINYDWYHPRFAHRQTEEEVKRWCKEAGLSIVHFHSQESGFTIRATKN